MSFIEDVAKALTQGTRTATVYLNAKAWEQAEGLKNELVRLRRAQGTDLGGVQLKDMEDTLHGLLETIEESKMILTFRSVGAVKHQELIDQHQSDDPAKRFELVTYWPALVSEACSHVVGPGFEYESFSEDEARELRGMLNEAQADEVFGAAWLMQEEAPRPFTYAAIDPKANSVLSSTLASAVGESLTPGS